MQTERPWRLDDFDYDLPAERIAQRPAKPRDHSRLMVVPPTGPFSHHRFWKLPEHLEGGDLLVVNRTQVLPARLRLRRPTGGQVELLLCEPVDGFVKTSHRWRALARPAKGLVPGLQLYFAGSGSEAVVVEGREGMFVVVRGAQPLLGLMEAAGEVPLPPYIDRPTGSSDVEDYQTVFAAEPGAVAAPTASLHFTQRVLAALEDRGVRVAHVVLHVGPGTFLPVRPEHADDIRTHAMHAEAFEIPQETQTAVEGCAGRVIAVGTTSVRALETWRATGATSGASRLFIYPGYRFRGVDGMITNFHLPRSTLLMLVAAFSGRERIFEAYRVAIAEGYRFFSYGDAMLLL